ncbi:MAG TPA: hypothetical protein IAA57_04305 [Candidatus Pullilachnospira intestinigallinarum]|nr:hypothetical protein [Candidatus Pullilachnospira intestinigallinarum]
MMEKTRKDRMPLSASDKGETPAQKAAQPEEKPVLSETWAQDALQDLDDFIESQGVYIRQ